MGNSGFQLNVIKITEIIIYHGVISFTQKRLDWLIGSKQKATARLPRNL